MEPESQSQFITHRQRPYVSEQGTSRKPNQSEKEPKESAAVDLNRADLSSHKTSEHEKKSNVGEQPRKYLA
jgi:hypothetical protein